MNFSFSLLMLFFLYPSLFTFEPFLETDDDVVGDGEDDVDDDDVTGLGQILSSTRR